MDTLQIRALLAGIFFGIWPLMMNRSGLSGNLSSFVFTAVVLIGVTPFAIGNVGNLSNANWVMAIGAGFVGALGIMSFNGMLAKATPQNVSTLFVMMILAQTALPFVYSIMMNGGVSATKGAGFILTTTVSDQRTVVPGPLTKEQAEKIAREMQSNHDGLGSGVYEAVRE